MSFSCVKSPWIFFESFRAAQKVLLPYLTPKKEVRVIAPKFRAHDYVYTAFRPKKPCFCSIPTTKRGFLGTFLFFHLLLSVSSLTLLNLSLGLTGFPPKGFSSGFLTSCLLMLRKHFKF